MAASSATYREQGGGWALGAWGVGTFGAWAIRVKRTMAISPSMASISRTRWPLPTPPIDGLQDISPIVSSRCVTSSVRAPARQAAAAASQPAWPPPTMMTSASRDDGEVVRLRELTRRWAKQRRATDIVLFLRKSIF